MILASFSSPFLSDFPMRGANYTLLITVLTFSISKRNLSPSPLKNLSIHSIAPLLIWSLRYLFGNYSMCPPLKWVKGSTYNLSYSPRNLLGFKDMVRISSRYRKLSNDICYEWFGDSFATITAEPGNFFTPSAKCRKK